MHNVRFLVADDSSVVRLVISSIIKERFGSNHIFVAMDGTGAMDILDNQKVDIIIADWSMPNVGGANFVIELLKNKSRGNVPVIVLSSEHDKVSSQRLEALGAAQHIIKPFQPEVLEEKIRASWNPADHRGARRYSNLPSNDAIITVKGAGFPVDIINLSYSGVLFRMNYPGDLALFETCDFKVTVDLGDGREYLSIDFIPGMNIRMAADECGRDSTREECYINRSGNGCPDGRSRLCNVALTFDREKVKKEVNAELESLIRWLEARAPLVVSDK